MSEIHDAAQHGYSTEAASYTRGRPEYPAALKSWLTKDIGIGAGTPVVDLGAGTGKFTRLLTAIGAAVTAIEPVDAMRDELSRKLPAVRALAGTADAMALPSGSFDAVLCAQAFHWFATQPALSEIHRVLKPGASLGLVWNVRDEAVDWVAAITEIITPYEGDAPRFYKGDWRKPFDGRLFTQPALSTFSYSHVGSPQQVIIDRFLSVSFIAALPSDEKAHVAQRLQALIDQHPALRGQSEVVFPYRTEAYSCQRLSS